LKPIPIFGVGLQGKSPNITAQSRVNAYYEIQQDEDKSKVSLIGTPGRTLFMTFGDTPCRGAIAVGSLMYVVHRGTFYEVNNAGVKVSRGTLNTTSGRVDIATNGAQIMVVDGTNGYYYTIATTTLAQIVDAEFPNGAATCSWADTYFKVALANKFYISAANDASSWDPLDFASAESSADSIQRIFDDHGELCVFGTVTTEFDGNTGATDFPYQNIRGSTAEVGLASRWSLSKFDDSLAFLGKNRLGQVQVYKLRGYSPVPISSPELDTLINAYTTKSDATGFAFMLGGHPMYQLNFPSAGKSWMYDGLTSVQAGMPVWSPLESGLSHGRDRAEFACDFLNTVRVFDYENGNVYNMAVGVYDDNGMALPFEVVGKHFTAGYDPITVDRLFADFETGVGVATGQGSNPQVMLQCSRDGGHTFGTEMWTSMGKIGEFSKRAEWWQFGTSRDFVWKLRITDPVKRVLVGAGIDAERGL